MGKKGGSNNGKHSQQPKKIVPFVSVCTPTFNRRPFIQTMFECFKNQTYPKSRIEWIIVDDGTDKIQDLISCSNIPQIKYFSLDMKLSLGAKRNYMHEKAKGSIIVYFDDDDYYPPERIEHAVERLTSSPKALCAGSSELYIYFKHIKQMYQCGPYGPNHATAGTFAFKRELLEKTQYESHAALAEEKAFLKDYTIPFVQLDPMKTILVFSHEQNTFDKRKLLINPHPQFCKPSTKTVGDFIRLTKEAAIEQYFMRDIDALLENYAPGSPTMKPDVLEQIKELDVKRAKMEEEARAEHMKQQMAANGVGANPNQGMPQIMVEEPGKPPRALNPQEIVQAIQQQQEQIKQLVQRNQELEQIVLQFQQKMMQPKVKEPEIKEPEVKEVETIQIELGNP